MGVIISDWYVRFHCLRYNPVFIVLSCPKGQPGDASPVVRKSDIVLLPTTLNELISNSW